MNKSLKRGPDIRPVDNGSPNICDYTPVVDMDAVDDQRMVSDDDDDE